MIGSVILQNARVPAIIATMALGAMSLPVLFTGLNGLDCGRPASARATPNPDTAGAPKASAELSSHAAPMPVRVTPAQSPVDPLPVLTRESDGVLPWAAGAPAGFPFKEDEKADGSSRMPLGIPAVAPGRDGQAGPANAVKRLRSGGPRVLAHGAAEGVSNGERLRKPGIRRPDAGEAAMVARSDGPRPGVSSAADAPSESSDSGDPYVEGGFTPNE